MNVTRKRSVVNNISMKFLLCMFGIFLIAEQIHCEESWKDMVQACQEEFPVSEKTNENDPKLKCFAACILDKAGLLSEDKKIDVAKYAESLKGYYPDADNTFESKVKECADKGNAKGDKCETVFVAATCVRNQFGEPKDLKGKSLW
uniref:Odorant-binding protein 2 n=1 Tax=Encarsia formosa TaxID=32400 RepID=A0A514TTX8_ENCFO|nr:odorant-binding protein 2 [Encarsia formosa]